MRTRGMAYRGAAKRGRVARTSSIPAPVGGLNARDALANMSPTDAVVMDNWVPGTSSAAIRKGYTPKCTGFAAHVETLATYRSFTTQKMFAVAGGSIYDTASNPVGAALSTGYSNSRFQTANFGNVAGQFLYMVNGADKAVLYDGTHFKSIGDGVGAVITSITHVGTLATVTTATPHGRITGDTVTVAGAAPADYNVTAKPITVLSATTFTYVMAAVPATNATAVGTYTYGPSIQGVDTALFKDVQVYGHRLWFTEKNSFRVWYLGLNSIAGTATSIDFAPLFLLGGSLQGMVVWTVTSEFGTTSYAVFVSSEGECVAYQGYDPDDPSNFTLAGSFRIGRPIGQRFWERVGTDTVLITQDGLVPLSKAAINNRLSQGDAISYKITNLVTDDISVWGNTFGWQVILYPLGNMILCNAPRPNSTDTVQYVMNTITNQWCRYTGIASYCWVLMEDDIYFGSDNAVFQAETGFNDNEAGIFADLQPAFSYFGASGQQKLFTTTRPIFTASGNFKPTLGLATDFSAIANPLSTPTLSLGATASSWDTSPWDVTAWGDETNTTTNWQWIGGLGFTASLRIQSLTKNMAVQLQSIDYAFEVGSGIY